MSRRRRTEKWARVHVLVRVPDRPLTEDQQLAAAMGFIQVNWTLEDKTLWCDLTKRLTGQELDRAFKRGDEHVAERNKTLRGCFGIPEVEYSDEPFMTGQVL